MNLKKNYVLCSVNVMKVNTAGMAEQQKIKKPIIIQLK